jgi:DNA topoisomerase II
VPAPTQTVEEKYRKLTDIEHVLHRPGMYVGSTEPREEVLYLLVEDDLLEARSVTYNPAFLKLFDEVVSNSVDEHRRNKKLNAIKVVVDPERGTIRVWDNGGIPVVKHSEHDEWVPEMIFSNLKAGSNFNDDEDRLVAGTNGVGSTLTNIFSRRFQIKTCDGKHVFEQEFRKNMTERDDAQVLPTSTARGMTQITFTPDLKRFGMKKIDDTHVEIMRMRCVELAACNPKLRIYFNGTRYNFPKFKDYCDLYTDDLIYEEAKRWKVGISPSSGSFEQISFVNSVMTRDGGTHVDQVIDQVVNWLRERINKKHKIDLKPSEIRNHLRVFVQSDIVNPAFSSQTKEKLITSPRAFGSRFSASEDMLKAVLKSEVLQRILDWAQQKELAAERKELRDLNRALDKEKVLKLIDAKAKKGRQRCSLALFEGDSASSAFRKYRDPQFQGAFPLRGKVLNVAGLPPTRIILNKEIKSLLTATGLKLGEEPKDLRYGKILIYADADPDGDSITGLLLNFFGRYWPELFEQKRIFRVMTPLVVVSKGAKKHSFYTPQDFEKWLEGRNDLPKWDISYKKGLAALEDAEYLEIIQNPRMFAITPGADLRGVLNTWFEGDAQGRKLKILQEDEADDVSS